MYWKMVLTIA